MKDFPYCCLSLTQSSIILTQMNNNKSTTVVLQFIAQDLFYKLNQKIQLKQIQKRINRRMPRMVTKNVISTLIDPSIKNSNHPNQQIMKKVSLQEGQEKIIEPVQLKVPTKRPLHENSQLLLPKSLKQSKSRISGKSDTRKASQSTLLVKLLQHQEEQSNEVKQIRKIKKLQQIYERQKQLNQQQNNRNRSISQYQKKHSLSECIYHHTYDYQTNILKVDELQRQNFAQSEQKQSFLQKIKENLDKQLQNERMQQKLAKVQEQNKKNTKIVPSHKIQKIEQEQQTSQKKSEQKEINKQLIQKKIKPQYKFQSSNIQSLSKDIESYLSQGIKLITQQNKIVKQNKNKDPIYQIKEESVIKEKQRSKKEKTITSQSVIYTYEKNMKKIPSQILDRQHQKNYYEQYKYFGDYKSQQFQKHNKDQNQEALTQLLRKCTKKSTFEGNSERNQLHLPVLEKYQHKKDFRKRNTTEQKILRGLDSIQINVRTPVSKPYHYRKQRQGYFSAQSVNKRTESSLQEDQQKINSGREQSRVKKQAIKQYFSNYKQQFKHRMKSISEAIKLYT